ncbi:MAG: hypothetical protein QOI50_618, partial [Pseudonocardiales bacterium]|nr:hypothetical protein [Pseudonocardiales bacterium]
MSAPAQGPLGYVGWTTALGIKDEAPDFTAVLSTV